MFYHYVEDKFLKGQVSVGLSANSDDKSVYLEAFGWTKLATVFLSKKERQSLADLSRADARKQASIPAVQINES